MFFIKEYDIFSYDTTNVLLNYITGACDLVDDDLKEQINSNNFDGISSHIIKQLRTRGYLFDNYNAYLAYINTIDQKLENDDICSPPNFLLIPSYACNLRCSYCFEQEYQFSGSATNNTWINDSFSFINQVVSNYRMIVGENNYRSEDIIITLMGGEPLLAENHTAIQEILAKVSGNGYSYNIITNGVNVKSYMDLFQQLKPNSVQITLDGTQSIHDSRRKGLNGEGTFSTIIESIHELISNQIPVFVRMNVDQENISCIEEFLSYLSNEFHSNRYCIPYLYPIQDGGCAYESTLLDEKNIIKAVHALEKKGVVMDNFQCVFHGSSLISAIQNNETYYLKLRNCAANKGQYILDANGYVYKCWFGVGNTDFSIGNYTDNRTFGNAQDKLWKRRSVRTLEKCRTCKYRYLCGGGCLSHVYKNTQDINKPRCVDFYELIKLQLQHLITSRSECDAKK